MKQVVSVAMKWEDIKAEVKGVGLVQKGEKSHHDESKSRNPEVL